MLYIVDGTGPSSDSDYRSAMASGHCKMLEKNFRAFAHYERGPGVAGFTNLGGIGMAGVQAAGLVNPLAGFAFEKLGLTAGATNQKGKTLAAIAREKTDGKIYLAGYSRGGATVISVAAALNRQGRPVEAMFLFDPVDSDATLDDTAFIPPNVKKTFMAYRNMHYVRSLQADADKQTGAAGMAGVKAAKNVLAANVIPQIPSFLPINPVQIGKAAGSVVDFGKQTAQATAAQARSFAWRHLMARDLMFELCVRGQGKDGAGKTGVLVRKAFDGTHGALGGCPWPKEEYPPNTRFHGVDLSCAAATWEWLNGCILQTDILVHARAAH
ncbi:MAG: hypothetical protein ACRCXM_02080 [Beijerinckiaceae bacterium]